MSGYNSYLTHSTIPFNNDKTSFYLTRMSAEQCFQFSFAKLSFLGCKYFAVVILEIEGIPSKTNEHCFELQVFPPSIFFSCWMINRQNENEWFSVVEWIA